jgi:hypothetical protein
VTGVARPGPLDDDIALATACGALQKGANEVRTANGDKNDSKHRGGGRNRRLAGVQPLANAKLPDNLMQKHHGSREGSRSQRSENGSSQHRPASAMPISKPRSARLLPGSAVRPGDY